MCIASAVVCCLYSVTTWLPTNDSLGPTLSSALSLQAAVGCRNLRSLCEIQKSGLNLVVVNKVNCGKIQGENTLGLKKFIRFLKI